MATGDGGRDDGQEQHDYPQYEHHYIVAIIQGVVVVVGVVDGA